MSHNTKQILHTASSVLSLIGVIAVGVFFFANQNTVNATQDLEIGHIKSSISTIEASNIKRDLTIMSQGDDVKDVKSYIKYGILPRLQLDEEEVLRRAKAAELKSDTITDAN